jgi:hypothetical protein
MEASNCFCEVIIGDDSPVIVILNPEESNTVGSVLAKTGKKVDTVRSTISVNGKKVGLDDQIVQDDTIMVLGKITDGQEEQKEEITMEEPMAPMSIDEVSARLREFGATEEAIATIKNLGVTTLGDLAELEASDFVAAGLKLVQAKKLVKTFVPEPVAMPVAELPNFAAASFDGILPTVPDDGSWLEALKAGGVLKVDQSSVISAVRAALAYRVGLYELPEKIAKAMEDFASKNDDPVDASVYFSLKKQLTRRNYSEIFAAIDGMDGSYVTPKLRKDFFDRMSANFLPAITSFYLGLKTWYETWAQGAANPMLLAAVLSGGGAALPPGIMQAPDTGMLRDQGDAVADAINKAFAGIGIQISAALAYDAIQIKKTLTDTRLPALIGAANRDQMLRQLGAAVSPTYPRLETNLTKFVLATIQAKDQPSGEEELRYFGSLYMLGGQIDWNCIGVVGVDLR